MTTTTPPAATFPRPDGEYRLQRTTYKGKPYVDLRFFWKKDDGELIPTRKGATLRLDEIHDLRAALDALGVDQADGAGE